MTTEPTDPDKPVAKIANAVICDQYGLCASTVRVSNSDRVLPAITLAFNGPDTPEPLVVTLALFPSGMKTLLRELQRTVNDAEKQARVRHADLVRSMTPTTLTEDVDE